MRGRPRSLLRLRNGRDLRVLFGLTILLPGVLLAVFAVRGLLQERRFALQQLRERLDRAADVAVRDLERELRDWQTFVDGVGRTGVIVEGALPRSLRAVVGEPGGGVVIVDAPGVSRAWPSRQLLYAPSAVAPPAPSGSGVVFARAESVELREKDYPRAIRLYEEVLTSAAPAVEAVALHRLARTLRKAGRSGEAMTVYERLASSPERIGGLPADLLARYEICAMLASGTSAGRLPDLSRDLYGDLVGGRWALDRPRYLFYATRVREWLSDAASRDIPELEAIEQEKRLLADAVTEVLDAGRSGAASPAAFFVVRTESPGSALMVLAKDRVSGHVWPQTFARTITDGFSVALQGADGEVLFGSGANRAGDVAVEGPAATRTAEIGGALWRLRVSPLDAATVSADAARRQTVYLVTIGLVMTLLGFGTYLTTRVVRRELEIARLRSDFVSTVSHEFRSPLTGIRQLGELLVRGRVASDERRQEYYERITRESDRLSRLVENLLDFSRMEDGRKEYQFARLDTSAWLQSVVDDVRRQYAERHMDIVASIPPALPQVLADHEALRCAVRNLLDNAVKYSPGRDTVWVAAEAGGGQVTLRVRDEGVGIAEDERGHIFERFYRSRAEITREVKGAGLGLSLVAHIVRAHGGVVECDSGPDGSTFSIRLNATPHEVAG